MVDIPNWANWVARDKDGELWTYSVKPFRREDGFWDLKNSEDKYTGIEETDDTFSHIKWTDEEPTEVKRVRESVGLLAEELNRITNAKAHGYDEVPTVADKTERVHVDKDGVEIAVGETTNISFEEAMTLVENRMENEMDDIAGNRYEKHRNLVDELHKIYVVKNKDYGNSFGESIDEFGIIAGVIRIGDKYNRLKTLAKGHEPLVNDESMVDTLKDMANYCLLTIIELEAIE